MDKPDDQEYLSYGIQQHGRRWAVVGLWLGDDYSLESDTIWESADGADEFTAKDKLVEISGFDRDRAKRAYARHSEKVKHGEDTTAINAHI